MTKPWFEWLRLSLELRKGEELHAYCIGGWCCGALYYSTTVKAAPRGSLPKRKRIKEIGSSTTSLLGISKCQMLPVKSYFDLFFHFQKEQRIHQQKKEKEAKRKELRDEMERKKKEAALEQERGEIS